MMMEDYVVYDEQRCTLEVSVVQTFLGKQTILPGSTHLFYNVAFVAEFRGHIREEYLVLQTLSRLFYGDSSNKIFTYCEVYQIDDGKYLLVVGEDLRNVDQDMTICRVYTATERVVKYLKSLD